MKTPQYLTTKVIFTSTLIVIALTIIMVWVSGLAFHRSLFNNSLISLSILAACFFLLLLYGLYHGIKLKDNIGKVTDQFKTSKAPDFFRAAEGVPLSIDGDGIGGIIISILLWLLVSLVLAVFLWLFGMLLWAAILGMIAMLYWIFFRALRLVFKKSPKCKSRLLLSMLYAIGYTAMYTSWIYGIILGVHYLRQL